MNCTLKFVYYTTVDSVDDIVRHRHGCYELVYYVSGSGQTTIEDKTYTFTQGTYSIMLPGAAHDQQHDGSTEVIYIGFEQGRQSVQLSNGVRHDDINSTVFRLLRDIKNEMMQKNNHYETMVESLLTHLLIHIDRGGSHSAGRMQDFSYITGFIEENSNQKIDFKSLAALSGYSYSRFQYLFKEHTGYAPQNFLMMKRIEKGKKMLRDSHATVTTIALECGFYDHSQFSRMFTKFAGCSPKAFRDILTQ